MDALCLSKHVRSSLLQEELGIEGLNLLEVRDVGNKLKWLLNVTSFSCDLGGSVATCAKLVLNDLQHTFDGLTEALLKLLESLDGTIHEAGGDTCPHCKESDSKSAFNNALVISGSQG